VTVQTLDELLAAHGLAGVTEVPLQNTGYSGSSLSKLVRSDGASFVLKRMSIERDWIMAATDDVACREAALAEALIELPDGVRTPNLGIARDGAGHALLMRDITPDLLPDAVSASQLAAIIARMAELHRQPVPEVRLPWCDLTRRLTLLTPDTARVAQRYGAPVASDLIEGWRLFERHARAPARDLIHSLFDDPLPLVRALCRLSDAFLHGDLKLDNIGLDPRGRMWLIDWAMTLVAPPAVELGWFLAINSRRLPGSLDDVMAAYGDAVAIPSSLRPRHDALTVLCGLLLRGWRKALDAEAGEPEELAWWCERAEAALPFLDA
jgi:hypothetical protein